MYFIQILNFCVSKDTTKKVEDNMQIGRKFMQIIYMIRTCTENIQRILKTSKGKDNKLNPSHPGRGRGRGPARLLCGAEGPRSPGLNGLGPGPQSLRPSGLGILQSLACKRPKPDSKWMWPKCTGWNGKAWGGGVACPRLHHPRGLAALSSQLRVTSPGSLLFRHRKLLKGST